MSFLQGPQGPLGAPDPRMLYVSDAVNFDAIVSRRTSRLALVGFICSLVWMFGILSLVGIGLSIAGIYATRGGKHAGRSYAVLGIIVGVLGLAATAFIVILGRLNAWAHAVDGPRRRVGQDLRDGEISRDVRARDREGRGCRARRAAVAGS